MSDKSLQQKSNQYWQNTKTTYLAAAEYYDLQEAGLRKILGSIGRVDSVGDVGCGDGRYSLVALDYANSSVSGYDFSPLLIAKANERLAATERNESVKFAVGSFAELVKGGPYNIVMCLGVLSAVIDDSMFEEAMTALVESVVPNGTLLTKDTLTSSAGFVSEQGDYVAMYRNEQSYLEALTNRGFQFIDRLELIRATSQTSNAIYRFTKVA